MKRRIKAFLVAALMVLTTVLSAAGAAQAEDLVVKLHYNRPDGVYDEWDVWFWAEGKDGAGYAFEEVDGEMVATFVAPLGTVKVGFIVRKPDWSAKDVSEDQFIDIAEVVSGTVHVYVESGVKGYTKEYEDNVVMGTKVVSAAYATKNSISVKMTRELENANGVFTVTVDGREIAITDIKNSGENYTLTLGEELDISKFYKITYDGDQYDIAMPDYYSTEEFESLYTYEGDDLGATWTKEATSFRVWAPTAESVVIKLYRGGAEASTTMIKTVDMTPDVNGTWVATVEGDLNGVYYTYNVTVNGITTEACDPYAKSTGVNGKRAMILDMDSTDPEGWENDKNPNAGMNITDAVIYELHIRDLGSDKSSGIDNVGKFLSLTEHGTTTESGISTGIDHIKDLGITHLHILPMYDYGSIDEITCEGFNWGYDPVNYNVPEGSYSTNPFDGSVRVSEAKQMVQSLHNDGISVIMDVVYNHVQSAASFCFNQIVPDYFCRMDPVTGIYSNGSGCGNDVASERAMVKKYIVDSVKYWADEYHIDGFRFDLVGLIDTETINEIMEEVHATHPDVIFYGEGWTMGTNTTKDGYTMTTQTNSTKVPGFAFFSDNIRDALKGGVFNNAETGYVSGADGKLSTIQQCFTGVYSWCTTPTQSVNYASCHDNNTLFDRLQHSRPDASLEDWVKMNNLAAAIYMTSQGIPFMQAGEEMLRSKVKEDGTFDHNSYCSPDSVNSIKWDTLNEEHVMDTVEYYKGLIAFRKAHPALRLTNAEDVRSSITTITGLDKNVAAFKIKGGVNGEDSDGIFVIFNPNTQSTTVDLPEGKWDVFINAEDAGTKILDTVEGSVTVDPISAMVLVQGGKEIVDEPTTEAPTDAPETDAPTTEAPETEDSTEAGASDNKGGNNTGLIVGIVAAVVAVAAVAGVVVAKGKKKEN